MTRRVLATLAGIALASVLVGHVSEAWARAGSGGSRGSRSYSAPARPSAPGTATTPSSPSRSFSQPTASMQQPSFFQRFGGAIAGFALGGLLGSMLFGGLGRGLLGGIGLMEILLIVGGILVLMHFMRRRRAAEAPAYAAGGANQYAGNSPYAGPSQYGAANTGAGGTAVLEMPAENAERRDIDEGLAHIRQMDPRFDPVAFAQWTRTQFADVQAAVSAGDIARIRERLAPEMYGVLLTQCDDLKAARRKNHVERIELARVEMSEAWQEKGQDFVTVYVQGSLVDYTVDASTGAVVDGSKTEPVSVEEFWTFTRPVGPNPFKLTSIQRA